MTIEVRAEPFDPYDTLRRHEAGAPALRGKAGASAVFVGSTRDFNENDAVQAMTLEHYPGMTEKYLERICAEACERWPILDALIVHRVGELRPGDPIVLVAAWSAHREAAFAACRYLIEELKSRAPFWKKEDRARAQARWVERNTPPLQEASG